MYAPSHNYGTPDSLRALVDAAHLHGIAVFLDVVYNHFGPDGCYAGSYGRFFSEKHKSSWGQGINLDDVDCRGVRNFFIDNALHWLREYRLDGLRLDATHALIDTSQKHFLRELAEVVEQLDGPRRVLIAEDERNEAKLVKPSAQGGYGLHGVWADDFHHQVRNITTGDKDAFFQDFENSTAEQIVKTLKHGWFYTGQDSGFSGKPRGTSTAGLDLTSFVIAVQNHDQVGNRAVGDRLNHNVSLATYRAISAMLLFAPEIPLIFMGQEFAAKSPFMFFTDHHGELGELVSQGRKKEFEKFSAFSGDVPDPQDPETYRKSQLSWDDLEDDQHAGILRLYQELLLQRALLPNDFDAFALSEYSMELVRGKFRLLVALRDDEVMPYNLDWQIEMHTEQPQFTTEPKLFEVDKMSSTVRFIRPGAILVTQEIGDDSIVR